MNNIRIISTVFIVAISLSILNSCGDDDNPTGSGLVSQIPNQVGMLWIYEVYDSLTQSTDTVSVSITENSVIGHNWRTFWKASGKVSDKVALVQGDTLDFTIDTTFVIQPLERFVFPLTLGSQWIVIPVRDSNFVTEIGTASVPAGNFPNSVLIERNWNYGIEGGREHSLTWIAPKVGIVSRYFHSTVADGGGNITVTKNQTWVLIDYDLSTFSISQFPNTVGDEWVYEFVDSRFDSLDTVTVSVVKNVQINGFDSTKMWLISGRTITDTIYVANVNNQVWVSDDTLRNFLFDWSYQFPLSVGRHWGILTINPIARISSKVQITIPAGTFPSAFHYTMEVGGFNYFWRVDDWLVPGVGVVKRNYWKGDFGPDYSQKWTLLSYKLK